MRIIGIPWLDRPGALLAAMLIPLAAGCEGGASPSPFAVRDSAGVRIAESASARWDREGTPPWTVGDAPIVDLAPTGSGPEHEFFRVADALFLEDGRIVVANSGSHQLRLYSPEGAHVASIGREGDGPGEFTRFFGVDAIAGDSLIAHSFPGRVTVLSPELAFVRTFDLGGLARRIRAFGDGMIGTLGPTMDEHRGGNALLRPPETVVRFDLEGTVVDTLLAVEGSEAFFFVSELGVSGGVPLFGRGTHVVPAGDEIVVGLADGLSFSVYDARGDLLRIARVPEHDLSLSSAEVDEELAARLGPNPDPFSRDLHDAMPRPDTRAGYDGLLVDARGHVWAGVQPTWPERRQRAARSWNVFSPEGEWLGTVRTPEGFTPFEIGPSGILGVRYDGLGVERVQVLPLQR